MTLKGGTSQACAACKYQRKRCTPECALAPHFRPEQTEIFKNAHKLFGVRNILRILEQVDPAMKNEAMRSIIYQANMRDRSPVHGCLGVIYQLQCQIKQAEKELYGLFSQLELYKQHQRRQHEIALSPMDSPESQQLQLGMGVEQSGNPGLTLFQNEVNDQNPHQGNFGHVAAFQISCSGNENGSDVINVDNKESMNMNNVMWGQQICYNENNDKSQMVNTQPLIVQDEVTHDYDEIYPFFDTIDDTQSYIDSKEANKSSSDSSLKEAIQSVHNVAGHTLKNAQLQLGIVSDHYQTFA